MWTTHLSGGTAAPVFSASVGNLARRRVSSARRGARVQVRGTVAVVVDVIRSSVSVPVVSVARCRVEPRRWRTSAIVRRQVASSQRGPTSIHVAVNHSGLERRDICFLSATESLFFFVVVFFFFSSSALWKVNTKEVFKRATYCPRVQTTDFLSLVSCKQQTDVNKYTQKC